MRKHFYSLFFALCVTCLMVGCATQQIRQLEEASETISLHIPEVVSGSSYNAIFRYSPPEKLKGKMIISGNFWWDNEGPFSIPPSEVNEAEGTVRFRLKTLTSGTYRIAGQIVYLEQGNVKTSNKVATSWRVRVN